VFPFDDPGAAIAGFTIIAAGYVIFGITGFGASLITIPVLSHFYPVPFVLALAGVLDLGSALLLGFRRRREAAFAEIRWLIPFSIAGAVLGVTLLVSLPRDATLLALGAFIGGYGIYGLAQRAPGAAIARGWAPVAGMLGGATGTLFGMGGPPYLIYLTRRIFDKGPLRATMSVMVSFSLVTRLIVFAAAGLLLQPFLVTALLWFVPATAFGLWLGHRLHIGIAHETLLRVLYLVLVGCGLSLLLRTGLFG
jgi:hypothetical protein